MSKSIVFAAAAALKPAPISPGWILSGTPEAPAGILPPCLEEAPAAVGAGREITLMTTKLRPATSWR
jgi:hypothetical protein